jgi:hypothetical protein
VIAHANKSLVAIDVESERYQHIGIIGVVCEGCVIGTETDTPVSPCIPGGHNVEMGDGMITQRFSEDELRGAPARMSVPTNVEFRVVVAHQDFPHILGVFDKEKMKTPENHLL